MHHCLAPDDARRQPAQARLARRAEPALGAVEARRRRARARRSATRSGSRCLDQEQAGIDIVTDGEQTRRHFVTTFIEGLDGVDFEHKRKTVRIRNRYDADVPVVAGPVARRHPIYVDDARFLRARDEAARQVHAARSDDDGRHAVRRALPEPREARVGVRRDPERRGACDRGGRRRRDPVRRAGVQRLLRRGARLGHRARWSARRRGFVHDRGAHLLRLRHQGQHRLEEARSASEWRQYEQTFPLLARSRDRPGVARMRELARADRADRPCSTARTCWSAPSTSPPTGSRRRKRSRRRSAPRWRSSRPTGCYPCTNCGMVPLRREVARGKLRALAAGAAQVRRELAALTERSGGPTQGQSVPACKCPDPRKRRGLSSGRSGCILRRSFAVSSAEALRTEPSPSCLRCPVVPRP